MTWPEFKTYCAARGLSARIEAGPVPNLHVQVWEGHPEARKSLFDDTVAWVPGWCDGVIAHLDKEKATSN